MEEKPKRKKTGGRQKLVPPVKERCVMLTEDQCKLLRMWGRGDMSAGLRWLIDVAAPMIRRKDEVDSRNSE